MIDFWVANDFFGTLYINFPAVAVILKKLVLLGLLACSSLINILTSRTKKPPAPILWEMHTNDSSSGHKVTLFYGNKKI